MNRTKQPDQGKAGKMERVAATTLALLLEGGLADLTFSRLARRANVSRPWLYEYIGPDKDSLIAFAVDHFGKLYVRLDARPSARDPKDWLRQIVQLTDEMLEDSA